MKTWFSMNCQTRKYLFQEFKYFFSIRVLHTVALISLLLMKFEKRFQKVINKKTQLPYDIVLVPKQKKEPFPY